MIRDEIINYLKAQNGAWVASDIIGEALGYDAKKSASNLYTVSKMGLIEGRKMLASLKKEYRYTGEANEQQQEIELSHTPAAAPPLQTTKNNSSPIITGHAEADLAMHSVGNIIAENAQLRFENARLKKALSRISAEALNAMCMDESQ